VAKGDKPLYETRLCTGPGQPQDKDFLTEFITHAALDNLDQKLWQSTATYYRQVDKYNDISISAYCTAGHVKFLLLHDPSIQDSALTRFFGELHQLYVKVVMNPFYVIGSTIRSKELDDRVTYI